MIIGLTYDHCTAYPMDCNADLAATIATEYETLESLCQALSTSGHSVVRIGNATDLVDRLAAGQRVDMIFNLCGNRGQACGAAQVPAILDAYHIPYTFSGGLAMSLCRQPGMMQSLLREHGIPVSDAVEATSKSASGQSATTAHQSEADCVVAILGSAAQAEAIGVLCCDGTEFSANGGEANSTADLYKRTALAAWRTLECQDAGCVYLRLDADGRPQVSHVEPLPSLNAEHSDLLRVANSVGMTLQRLIEAVLQSAMRRVAPTAAVRSARHALPQPHIMPATARPQGVSLGPQ